MKKFILLIVFCLAICGFAFAQTSFPELDKVKKIKLLESTREDVKKIFTDYPDFDSHQIDKGFIYTKHINILMSYSSGKCSNDPDDFDDWNVPEGNITEIELDIKDSIKPQDLGIDLSKLKREKIFRNSAIAFVYFDKNVGIGYEVWKGEIATIIFRPSKENYPLLCNNERVKKIYSSKSWYRDKLKDRWYSSHPHPIANIDKLTISKNEITTYCVTKDLPEAEACSEDAKIEIEAKATSSDPTDVLTYNYTVSGGKIIGTGASVTWDLTGVKPGKYTITAGVDNGCGVCGTTKTEEVVVKTCSDCAQK